METPDQVGGDACGGRGCLFRAGALWSRGVQGFAEPFFLVRRTLDPRRAGLIVSDDDAGGIQVVVEGLGFAEELRAEEELRGGVLLLHRGGEADRDGALDDHHGSGVHLQNQLDDFLDVTGIEEVLDRVVVGRRGDDDEVGARVSRPGVQGRGEIQLLLGQIFLDILVLNGADPVVDLFDLLGNHVHGHDGVPLRE